MRRLNGAVKVGLVFGLIGLALTTVGIVRGNVPMNPGSLGMALLIGGGVWFLVSWAVATAALDVETDVASAEEIAAIDAADAAGKGA
jgi:hypothetical protein